MRKQAVIAAGLVMVLMCSIMVATHARADEGRAMPSIQDLTQLPPAIVAGDEVDFRANCTDADGDMQQMHLLLLDGAALALVEEDPTDVNTTDGKTFHYAWTAEAGSHIYGFAFFDGSSWTNSTATDFEVRWAPETGDWEVSSEMTVADADIELQGNLLVRKGGALELKNSTLKFNGDTESDFGVLVEGGASLKMSNGSKVSKSIGAGAYNFRVLPGGSLRVTDSEIWYAGYEDPASNSHMGIFVEGETMMEGSAIISGSKGIIAENCSLVMRNTTVRDTFRSNVEATNATITLEDCLIYSSTDACNVELFAGASALINRCTIQKNGHSGIWMRDGATATVARCLITDSNQNGVWMDNSSTLTISDTVIEKSGQNGMWINGSSVVTATNVTIRNNQMNGTWISGGRITMTLSTIDANELHGFAAFDGCQVTFTKNRVNNSLRHNYEATNCTTVMEDCRFDPSRKACNVEFFAYSKATVRRTTINGAGHNCFWFRDYAEITIEDCNLSSSPNNVIWLDFGCKLTVRSCVLSDVPLDGINCSNSSVTVEGCTIRDCGGWGINSVNCTLSCTGCTFSGNGLGQVLVRNYLSVRALDPRGRALSGATVKITDQDGAVVFSGKSGADGGAGGPMLLTASATDNAGKRMDYTYTIKVTKGDYEGSQKVALTGKLNVEVKTWEKPRPGPGFEVIGLLMALGAGVVLAGRGK